MILRTPSRQTILIIFIGLLMVFYIIRYQSTANDFAVYARAGEDFRAMSNPWSYTGDINNSYLYGPFTTILISIYTIMPIEIGVGILRLITLLALAFVAMRLTSFSTLQKISVLGLVLLCAPVRANLEYGNFTVLLLCTLVLVAPFNIGLKRQRQTEIIFGILSAIAIDYKPHLFFPVAAIALFWSARSRVSFTAIIILGFLSTSLFLQKNVLLIWLSSIRNRVSESSITKPDQMDLHSILSQMGILIPHQIYFFAAVILILSVFIFKKSTRNIKNLMISVALVFPFLHSSDLGILIVVLILTSSRSMRTKNGSAAIGLLAVWSNNIPIASLTVLSIFCFVYFIEQRRIPFKQAMLILGPNLIFLMVVFFIPSSGEVARHILNFLGILFFIRMFDSSHKSEIKFLDILFSRIPIFIHSAGGFGNRLFAISYCHYIHSQTNRKVFINLNDSSRVLHDYADACSHVHRDKFQIGKLLLLANLVMRKIGIKRLETTFFIFDDSYRFQDSSFNQFSIYISGYYQNAEYVLKNSSNWAEELVDALNRNCSTKIKDLKLKFDYHAMHIRRGDLLESSEQRGVLSLDYYSRDAQQHGINIVILTDATHLILEEIKARFPQAVVFGPELSVDVAYLIMLNARTFTPANSTLSWFAALHRYLLGTTPGKLPFPFFESGPPSEGELGGQFLGIEKSVFLPKVSYPKNQ